MLPVLCTDSMNPADLKPYQLQYLIAVAEQGSLRLAAQTLGVSPSAVSKGLKELEDVAQVVLFERHARGYVLSAAGRLLLARARTIITEMEAALREMRQTQAEQVTELSVGITPWVMHSILPAVLQRFKVLRPDVRLRIEETLGTEYAGLRDGKLDFSIGLAPHPEDVPEFLVRPLFSYVQAVACREGHACAKLRSLEALKGQEWILSHELRQYGAPFHDFFATHYTDPVTGASSAKAYFTRSSVLALHVVENSDMLSILPWPLVETMRARYRIGVVPLRDTITERHTAFITRRNTPCNGAIGQFVDVLMALVQETGSHRDAEWARIYRTVELISR